MSIFNTSYICCCTARQTVVSFIASPTLCHKFLKQQRETTMPKSRAATPPMTALDFFSETPTDMKSAVRKVNDSTSTSLKDLYFPKDTTLVQPSAPATLNEYVLMVLKHNGRDSYWKMLFFDANVNMFHEKCIRQSRSGAFQLYSFIPSVTTNKDNEKKEDHFSNAGFSNVLPHIIKACCPCPSTWCESYEQRFEEFKACAREGTQLPQDHGLADETVQLLTSKFKKKRSVTELSENSESEHNRKATKLADLGIDVDKLKKEQQALEAEIKDKQRLLEQISFNIKMYDFLSHDVKF